MTRRLLAYFRPYAGWLFVAFWAMALAAGLSVGSTWLVQQVIDQALLARDVDSLKDVVGLILMIYFVKSMLSYVHDYLSFFIGQEVVRRLRDETYAHMQSLSMDFFTATDSSRLISRLTNDAKLVQDALTKVPVVIVRDGLTALGFTGYLIFLNWRFALMVFAVYPLSAVLIVRFGKSLRRSARQGAAKMADLYTMIQETVSGAAVVKAFEREAYERERFRRENEAYFKISLKNARVESLSNPVMELLGALGLGFLLWKGGGDVVRGVWTTGGFFAFLAGAMQLYQPLKNISKSNATLQQAFSGAERLFQLLDTPPSVADRPGAKTLAPFSQALRFENVGFFYRPDRWVLRGVNVTLGRGQVVALVGPSGSGKTSLASLLLRFYDPQEGRVTLDGEDVKNLTQSSLRENIGLVTQETHLFNDTVRANIAYGRLAASESDIIAASRAANAWGFIEKLPQKLDTLVGERGVLLSGGQKQRLAIARALLKNPPILVLDEATSALDTESERLVQEALERLMSHRTVLVIAHRLSTVQKADLILVLEHGQVVESGSHADLLSQGGLYHRLHQLQFTGVLG